MATQPTLSIKTGDLIYVGVRRQNVSPQTVLTVTGPIVSATSGSNVYTITTAQQTLLITPNSTVLEAINSAGQGIWVVGQ